MEEKQIQTSQKGRITALDRTRGLCILLMLLGAGIGFFQAFGPVFRLFSDTRSLRVPLVASIYFADFAVPCFLSMVGMSYTISFHKRYEKVGKKAYLHFLFRYLIFLGMGSIMVSAEYLVNGRKDPLLLLPILMFLVFAFGLMVLVQKLCFPKAKKAGSLMMKGLCGSVALLGVIGILLGIVDCVYQFTSPEEVNDIYANSMMHWSILHAIGMAGIWGLLYAPLSLKNKLITFFSVGAVYTLLESLPGRMEYFSIYVLGGFVGTIGWSLALLAGMILMELYLLPGKKGAYGFMLFLLVDFILMVPALLFLPASSRGVSSNFLLMTIVFYGFLFCVSVWTDGWKPRLKPLTLLGRNPLISFGIGVLFKAVLIVWDPAPETPIWAAFLFFLLAGTVEFSVVSYLDKKGKSIHI
ncbi:MAG: hypothetical protein KBS81_09740 [Spirochaetales bacterium]|nr:hypothetical protein [Candidatus Physcosoma equi]